MDGGVPRPLLVCTENPQVTPQHILAVLLFLMLDVTLVIW